MTNVTNHTPEVLKSSGHFFAAGALAQSLNQPRAYGPHYGMRSTLEADRGEFFRGWDAAAQKGGAA